MIDGGREGAREPRRNKATPPSTGGAGSSGASGRDPAGDTPRSIGFKPVPSRMPVSDATVSAGDVRSWERVCAKLKAKLGDDVFASWFGRARLDAVSTGHVSLSVPTNFLRSWIRTHYARELLLFWQEERADVLRIDIAVRTAARNVPTPPLDAGAEVERRAKVEPPALDTAAPTPVAPTPTPAVPATGTVGFDGSPLDARLTFSNIVEGRANAMALAAARSVVAPQPGAPRFNPLFVHANVGLGKTHLLQAIAWSIKSAEGPGAPSKILYLTAEYFMWRFASAIRDRDALTFKESLRGIDLLLIDDMQFLQGKSIQEEFCHLLNALIDSAKQVVVAADRPPAELESLDQRVRSRLQGGIAIEIKSPEYDMRRAILDHRIEQARATDPALDIPDSVLDHVADQVTGSARDLEGAFNQLLMQHRFGTGPLSMERIDQMLAHLVQSSEPKRVRIEDIQKIVGRHYNVSRNDLLSSRRTQVIVRPRQIAMYLAKTLTPRSLPEIGRRFGGRDHTTVLHAVRKIEKLAGEDPKLAQELELLKRLIQEG